MLKNNEDDIRKDFLNSSGKDNRDHDWKEIAKIVLWKRIYDLLEMVLKA